MRQPRAAPFERGGIGLPRPRCVMVKRFAGRVVKGDADASAERRNEGGAREEPPLRPGPLSAGCIALLACSFETPA